MTSDQLALLEDLILMPSPSGFEDKIADYIVRELSELELDVVKDFQNNVVATIEGRSNRTVMVDAHIDQLGFIVNNIDDHGQISLDWIGGGDSDLLGARNLVILANKRSVNAVVNRKPSHLVINIDDEVLHFPHEALVDIGIRERKAVNAIVEIGDPVVCKPVFEQLVGDHYTGCGLDDKVGVFMLIETIRRVVRSGRRPIPNLVFTFSSQEETWGRKCRPLVKKYKPDLFIEVDVTFATDWDEKSWEFERQVGQCRLGEGVVLYRGVDIHKKSFGLMQSIAKASNIKTQVQASTGQIGYTATEISSEGDGIRAFIVAPPLRNMHTPVEVVNLKDLTGGIRLLFSFLTSKRIEKVFDV